MHEKPTTPMVCPSCEKPFMGFKSQVKRGIRCCTLVCANRDRRQRTNAKVWASLLRHPNPDGCWDYTGRGIRNGYGFIHRRDEESFMHRRAWVAATGGTLTHGDVIAHICDRRICCRNDDVGIYAVDGVLYPRRGHLFKTTITGNQADMVAKNRQAKGVATGLATLNDANVLEVRAAWTAEGITQREIAEKYGVRQGTVSRIVQRKLWTHI